MIGLLSAVQSGEAPGGASLPVGCTAESGAVPCQPDVPHSLPPRSIQRAWNVETGCYDGDLIRG